VLKETQTLRLCAYRSKGTIYIIFLSCVFFSFSPLWYTVSLFQTGTIIFFLFSIVGMMSY
jgi:hypothetical protein